VVLSLQAVSFVYPEISRESQRRESGGEGENESKPHDTTGQNRAKLPGSMQPELFRKQGVACSRCKGKPGFENFAGELIVTKKAGDQGKGKRDRYQEKGRRRGFLGKQ